MIFPNWNPNNFDLFKLEEGRTSRPQGLHEAAWLQFQDWMGRPCTVYAERMIPKGSDLPCILHAVGGAQTVRTEDLAFWADQGYACASFDWQIGEVQPREPERTSQWPESVRPQHGPHESLDQCVLPLAIQAAQITLSWLLDHPAVDATRVGMTGISWGGYLTWATAAYDKRIRATCPVFGCGIFNLPGIPERFTEEVRSYWQTHWDPQALAKLQTAPAAYLSATNDFFGEMSEAGGLLSRLPVASRWSLLPNADHAIGPGESALARAWMAHYLKGGPGLPVLPSLSETLSIDCDPARDIAYKELWWTSCPAPSRFACWNKSPVDPSARLAFVNVTYRDGLSLCSTLVQLQDSAPLNRLPDTWRTLPEGIGWRWELGSTQFHGNEVVITPLEDGRAMEVTPAPGPEDGPIALLLSMIRDPRWKPQPGDRLRFRLQKASPATNITAFFLISPSLDDPEAQRECVRFEGLYQLELPASLNWPDVLGIRLVIHGKREPFTFGGLTKVSGDPE